MRELYPELEPYHSFQLATDSVHKVYVEEAGNKNGIPVIFLHGGPGSGCKPNHRCYFNPDIYRIVIFDQRGCNRSTPQGEIADNSTQLILKDMETLREKLHIDGWLLFGGSWGATLALLYAETFPQYVKGLILRGSFLARQQDLDWFIKDGANRLFPDEWQKLLEAIPGANQGDMITAFHAAVHGDKASVKLKAARAWSRWCTKIVSWNFAGESSSNGETDNDKIINEVAIETHFAMNRYFISDNQILDEITKIPDVPVYIVHGRQDITCLMEASWKLHRGISHSTLEILPGAGHLAGESAMIDALVRATDKFAEILA